MKYEELYSQSSESGVIATLIHKPSFIYAAEDLHPRDFYDSINACLFWAIKEISLSGVDKIEDYQLDALFKSNKAIEAKIKSVEITDIQSILSLSNYACRENIEDFKFLVQDILDYKSRRSLYEDSRKLSSACLSDHITSQDLDRLAYELADNRGNNSSRTKNYELFGTIIDDLYHEQEERQSGNLATIPFHIEELNDFVEMEAGELVVFGAEAKEGKSAMLLSCTVDLLKKNQTVLVIDSELSDRLYMLRLLAHITKIPFRNVKDGMLDAEQRDLINRAINWVKSRNFYHIYMPIFNDAEVMTMFRKINHATKVDVLVVDYFKVTSGQDAFSVSLNLSGFVNTVKNEIAGAYKIPVISAIQTTSGGHVALSAGVIRYCSTLVLMKRKTTQEYQADGGSDFGNTYLRVAINRNGRQQTEEENISVDFIGDILTYQSAKEQPERREPY